MKVAVVSHEWEALRPGGAQRSAVALARSLSTAGVQVVLISVVDDSEEDSWRKVGTTGNLTEVVVTCSTDPLDFSWLDPRMATLWEEILEIFRPDVIHLNHYYRVGLELPLVSKSALGTVAVVMTLHEYMAICLRSGQMVTGDGGLCAAAGVAKCARCTDLDESVIATRNHYVQAGLSYVDHFITPSQFARHRFIDWGLDPARISVLSNVVDFKPGASGPKRAHENGIRLTYVGQHTPFKGLEVLLRAARIADEEFPGVVSDMAIYGSGSEQFGEDFVNSLSTLAADVPSWVRWPGSYRQDELGEILAMSDAVVVPSTWWENSPVVIEEALIAEVPIICSNIGGMAEKVRDGLDGWHFEVGSARSLADVVALNAELIRGGFAPARHPDAPESLARDHLLVYEAVLARVRNEH